MKSQKKGLKNYLQQTVSQVSKFSFVRVVCLSTPQSLVIPYVHIEFSKIWLMVEITNQHLGHLWNEISIAGWVGIHVQYNTYSFAADVLVWHAAIPHAAVARWSSWFDVPTCGSGAWLVAAASRLRDLSCSTSLKFQQNRSSEPHRRHFCLDGCTLGFNPALHMSRAHLKRGRGEWSKVWMQLHTSLTIGTRLGGLSWYNSPRWTSCMKGNVPLNFKHWWTSAAIFYGRALMHAQGTLS